MPIDHLDHQQSLAFLEEITSTRNLLAYGIRAIRAAAFWDTTRDPILSMLSIGVEKLYKLTLGVAALDTDKAWPPQDVMQGYGHGVAAMHDKVMVGLSTRAANSTPYLRDLLAKVQADPLIPPLIAVLDRYGRKGRFYYLDLLGAIQQPWDSPADYWQAVELAATTDPEFDALYTAALAELDNNELWNRVYSAIRERIAQSVLGLWKVISAAGENGALGRTGRIFGVQVGVDLVGRQIIDA